MVPPPREGNGNWSFTTLLAHITGIIDANDRRYVQMFGSSQEAVLSALNAAQTAVNAALNAAEKAVTKAEAASEKRFEGVNEFRATLADQQRTLMPRTEVELLIKALETQVRANTGKLTEAGGHATGAKEMWGYIIGAVGLLLAIASRFI